MQSSSDQVMRNLTGSFLVMKAQEIGIVFIIVILFLLVLSSIWYEKGNIY